MSTCLIVEVKNVYDFNAYFPLKKAKRQILHSHLVGIFKGNRDFESKYIQIFSLLLILIFLDAMEKNLNF